MMLSIAAAEFRYMFWSLQTLLTFGALFGIGFLLTANAGEFQSFAPGGTVLANSPYAIADTLIRLSVFCVIAVPAFVANALLKDVDHQFDAIVYALPISKADYLNGRLIGALAAMLIALSGTPFGLLLGTFWPWVDAELLGPTRLVDYVYVYLGIVTPSVIAVSMILFAVTATTRSLMLTYVGAMLLLLLYFVGSLSDSLSPLIDPFLYRVFAEQTRYVTAIERNTQLIAWDGMVIANRILWLGIAGVFYALAYRRFAFRTAGRSAHKSMRGRRQPVATPLVVAKRTTPDGAEKAVALETNITPGFGPRTEWLQFLARTRFEMAVVLKGAPFLILMGLSALVLFLSLTHREIMYDVNAYPITRLMVGSLTMLTLPMMIVCAFYSAEIFWRERQVGCSSILDAMPAPNWVFVLSKLTALAAVLTTMILVGLAMGVALQASEGYYHFEWGLYLRRALITFLLPMIFMAVMTCFLQVLAQNRYFGMVLFGLFFAAIVSSRDLLGWEHPLLSFVLPVIPEPLSDMNGFGQLSALASWTRLYWGAIAGMLLLLTYLLWNRGTAQPLRYRLKAMGALRTARFAVPATLFAVTGVASAGYIYYNTNILNQYTTDAQGLQYRADYERQYGQYEHMPQPRIVAIDIDVDLFPDERRVVARSTHILENTTDVDIAAVHLVFPTSVQVTSVDLQGASSINRETGPINYYMVDLIVPMNPGEQRQLRFETRIERIGFEHYGQDTTLVGNGTFLINQQLAPHVGFQPDFLIRDPGERKWYGLPPRPRRPKLEDSATESGSYNQNVARGDSDFISYRTTVSTVTDQVAIAVGALRDTWLEGERRYFRYEAEAPIRNFYSYLSARYQVVEDSWNDVNIEIYYHRGHEYNLDRMTQAVKDSLDYYSTEFSPYQYSQLRIVEFPAYRTFAQAYPGMIPYSEGMGFVADVSESDLDMPYYVTAHEVAHQWWGHQVAAANVQGDGFVHETLAQYSALLVMEQRYGPHQIRRFLKHELDRYLSERASDPIGERPLYREEDQSYIYYRKGSVVMYALRDYLGTEVVNEAIRRLIELRAYKSRPYATSLDFIRLLKEETAPEHHGLIEDLLERITLFDTAVSQSRIETLPDGTFAVELDVSARKFYSDESGTETPGSFDIPVDIGLFARHPDDPAFTSDDVISLGKYAVQGSHETIKLIVERRPAYAGIDPYHKLIDRETGDNMTALDP